MRSWWMDAIAIAWSNGTGMNSMILDDTTAYIVNLWCYGQLYHNTAKDGHGRPKIAQPTPLPWTTSYHDGLFMAHSQAKWVAICWQIN